MYRRKEGCSSFPLHAHTRTHRDNHTTLPPHAHPRTPTPSPTPPTPPTLFHYSHTQSLATFPSTNMPVTHELTHINLFQVFASCYPPPSVNTQPRHPPAQIGEVPRKLSSPLFSDIDRCPPPTRPRTCNVTPSYNRHDYSLEKGGTMLQYSRPTSGGILCVSCLTHA